mgnify:CR=1 FL=1
MDNEMMVAVRVRYEERVGRLIGRVASETTISLATDLGAYTQGEFVFTPDLGEPMDSVTQQASKGEK